MTIMTRELSCVMVTCPTGRLDLHLHPHQAAECSAATAIAATRGAQPAVSGPAAPGASADPVLAFGYLRYLSDALDVQVAADEKAIKVYAARQWWVLEKIYVEEQAGMFAEFDKMLADAVAGNVRHLIVPSASHLSPHRLLRAMLVEHAAEKNLLIWSAHVNGSGFEDYL